MHEELLASIIRLDETVAFLAAEPVYPTYASGHLLASSLLPELCRPEQRYLAASSVPSTVTTKTP